MTVLGEVNDALRRDKNMKEERSRELRRIFGPILETLAKTAKTHNITAISAVKMPDESVMIQYHGADDDRTLAEDLAQHLADGLLAPSKNPPHVDSSVTP